MRKDVYKKHVDVSQEAAGSVAVKSKGKRRSYEKSAFSKYRWVIWLLIMIPIVYFAIQVVYILMPRMKTQIATLEVMTDSISATGSVVLKSEPVYGSGVLHYTFPAGHRVPAGSEVAKVFSNKDALEAIDSLNIVNLQLEQLEAAGKTKAEGGDIDAYLKQTQQAQLEYLQGLQIENYDLLEKPILEMELAGNKMQIVTGDVTDFESRKNHLLGLKEMYEAAAVPIDTITTPTTGYFTPAVKNDRIGLTQEEVAAATPIELQTMLQKPLPFYGNDVAGHVISDYQWSFYTVVPSKQALLFKEGDDSLKIQFPEVDSEALPVKVVSVEEDKENGIAKIELTCDRMSPEILQLRTETAHIIFSQQKGIRVDKNALRIVNGQQCVYVKLGNQIKLKKIKILLEDEHYMLLPEFPEDDVNEVELYDEVIVDSGGVELHGTTNG